MFDDNKNYDREHDESDEKDCHNDDCPERTDGIISWEDKSHAEDDSGARLLR